MKASQRFFGVLLGFSLLFFAPIKHESLAACGADPNADSVKIAGHAYTSTSIQDAYNYASTTLNLPSFTLQLAGEIFTEDLLLDGGAVVLDGGWDCSFTTKTSPSRLFGKITIKSGSLNVAAGTESPKVVSTGQCAFDNDVDGYTSIGSCTGSADDCNDNDFAINSGASEICDGLDNNCDSQIDEGLTGTDADGDGYYAIGSCGAVADDCNDNNAGINPGAVEIPYDGIDQDCSGADLTYANGNACADCHVPDDALDSVHNYRPTATDSSCVLCHAGPVSSILSGHYGKTVRTEDNYFLVPANSTINCWTCHDNSDHSGGPVPGAFGDGRGDVWNDVAPPYPGNYTCDDCHADRAARHATATAHNNRVIDSTCANCHTSDTTTLGSPGTGSLASAADVDALHGVAQVTDCALCHNYSGILLDKAVVLTAIRQGLSGTQVSCLDCHTDKGTNHGNFNHPIEVGPFDLSYNPGQLCSDCHVVANWTEIEGTEHNVDTNGAGSCATCHNSSRQIVQNVIADAPSNGGYPIRCLACHADKELVAHGSVDHTTAPTDYVNRGTSFCLNCHDPGTAANATVDITHNGTCSLCHTTIPALQPGVPAGGGDCLDCHIDYPTPGTNDWYSLHVTNPPDHSALVTTAGTDNCASCHENQLFGSTATTHLENCSNCHNASDGSLKSLAIGQTFTPGNNCQTCHTDSWEVTHTNANTPDHGILVRVDATSCGDCHDDTFISAAANTHNGCDSCHNTNGSPKSSAVGKDLAIGGDCTTCHGVDYFDSHTHTHDVSYNPLTDTSQVTQQGCATCHNDSAGNLATFADIVTEHGTCSRCHDYTDDGNGTPPQLTVETTIASGTGVTCATCHTPKVPNVDHGVDHIASGYVTGEAACLVCHTDPATTFTDSNDAKVHNGCTTCHDAGTNALIGSAVNHGSQDAGFGNPNVCTTCHTGRDWTDHNIDHQTAGYVTLHSECTSCHAATMTAGQDFINPADDEKHNACTSCHAASGAISVTVNDCSECHSGETGDWTTHAQDHTVLVTQQAECSSCHSATVEYVNFVDPANNVKHDDCYVCHDNTTKLASATAGDCSQCHTANYFDSHTHTHDVSYNPLTDTSQTTQQGCALCHNDSAGNLATFADIVTEHGNCSRCHFYTDDGNGTPPQLTVETTIATGTGVTCATCHTPKVPDVDHGVDHIGSGYVTGEAACLVCHTDPATTFTDSNDAKVHNGCTTCHDAGTNALIGSAVNHGSQDAGFGNPNVCTTCHMGRDWTDHDIDHQTDGYVTLHSECTSCHAATMTAGQGFIDPADDEKHNACTSCHAANGSISVTVNDCSECHSGETTDWTTHAQDHTVLVTQQAECSSCHSATVEYVNFVDPANNVKHDDCYVCHDNTTKLASATAGDCSQCHTANYFDSHTHTHDVSYNPLTDTSQTTQQGCALCHNDSAGNLATFADIVTEHGTCSRCHDYTDDGNGTPPQLIVESTIATGTGVTCATCHTPKVPDVDHGVDHIGSGYVTGEAACLVCHTDPATTFTDSNDAKVHNGCTTCHDAGTNALIGSAVNHGSQDAGFGNPNVCTTCHTGRDWTDHDIDHQGSGYVTLHSECTSCHADTMTAGQGFINPADDEKHNACTSCHAADGAIATGSVDCSACHSGETTDWTTHAEDHTLLVIQATGCATCHNSTVDYVAFVSAVDNLKHDGCYVCHNVTTKLASAAAGDCSQCHSDVTGDFATHTTQDHTTLVTQQAECSSCHTETVDYANFIDAANDKKHDACSTCHNATTNAPVATAGDCSQCHTGTWEATHSTNTPSHNSLVTVAGTTAGWTNCGSCHSDPPPLTDIGDPKVHDACDTCHNANGSLVTLLGTHTQDFATGGNCETCHTSSWNSIHNSHSHTVELGAGDLSAGTSCGSCHVVANWSQINGTEHNVATNGPSSCETCHNSARAEVITAISTGADPTNCLNCHSANAAAHGSVDHVADGYVTLTSPCNDCHDPGSAENATVDVTHSGNCSLCHTTVPALQTGVPVGGGTCATCHTGDVQTAHPDCTACHGEPPSGSTAPNRDRAHSEHDVLGYGSVNPSCNACHNGASHYDGSTQVSIPSSFNDKDSGSPSFNGSTCSNTSCHGGQTTPAWATGTLDVDTQCRSCHVDRDRDSDQYNSYYSGEHDKHVRGENAACTDCHSISKLANGNNGNTHFSNLQTTSFELSPGLTVGGSDTVLGNTWNNSSNTCSNLTCHGETHDSGMNW